MKITALIPARLESQRFPGKLLKDLGGKPVIVRTWHNAVRSGAFDRVIVVTPNDEIARAVRRAGGEVYISRRPHPSGTDRIAEAARESDADIIVNIQGDEPFLDAADMRRIREIFERDTEGRIDILSFCRAIEDVRDYTDPSVVKVVTDKDGFALYFSRAPIPFARDGRWRDGCRHIGIYAFRREVLMQVAQLPPVAIEEVEKLENLRFLVHGYRVKMLPTTFDYAGIDTPADLEKARKKWK